MKTIRTLLLASTACIFGTSLAHANFTMQVVVNTNNNSVSQFTVRDYSGTAVSGATGISPIGSPGSHTNPTYYIYTINFSLPDSYYGQPVSVGTTPNTGGKYSAMFSALYNVQLPFEALNSPTNTNPTTPSTGASTTTPPPLIGDVTIRNPLGDSAPSLFLEADTYVGGNTTTVDTHSSYGVSYSIISSTPTLEQQFIGSSGQWRWAVQTGTSPNFTEQPVMTLDSNGILKLNSGGTTAITMTASTKTLDMGTGTISNVGSLGVGALAANTITISGGISIAGSPVLTQASAASVNLSVSTLAVGASATATGINSLAGGSGALASGANAVALGLGAQATADRAIAIGANANATAAHGIAIGSDSYAISPYSFAAGGYRAFAFGAHRPISNHLLDYNNSTPTGASLALGSGSAVGDQCAVVGLGDSFADGYGSSVYGYGCYVVGMQSSAYGVYCEAHGPMQTVIGSCNEAIGLNNDGKLKPDPQDIIFIIGNGYQNLENPLDELFSNAMTIRQDAGTTIGTGLTSSAAAQIVVGQYNDTTVDAGATPPVDKTKGLFIVGAGTSTATADRKNAMRVAVINGQSVVLIQAAGDLDMGEFQHGDQP